MFRLSAYRRHRKKEKQNKTATAEDEDDEDEIISIVRDFQPNSVPVSHIIECLALYTCRLASALSVELNPFPILVLQPVNVKQIEYDDEVLTLIRDFPRIKGGCGGKGQEEEEEDPILHVSQNLAGIRTYFKQSCPPLIGKEAAFFYLAASEASEDVFTIWTKEFTVSIHFYLALRREIRGNVDLSQRTLTHILTRCLEYDLTDRYISIRDLVLDLPSFVSSLTRNWILVFLAHFHRDWVRKYIQVMKLPLDRALRVQEFLKDDFGTYCLALKTLSVPPASSYFKRYLLVMGDVVYPGTETEQFQRSIALNARHPVSIWTSMGWTCAPNERDKMTRLAEDRFSITVEEAVDLTLSGL